MSLTRLASFTTIGEAEAARSALDAAGIFNSVADENAIAVNWLISQAIGGVKLFVREEDREQAEKILEEAAAETSLPLDEVVEAADEEPVEDEEEVRRVLTCPNCGSTDIARLPRLMVFAGLSVVIIGVGVAVSQPGMALAGVVAIGLIVLLARSHHCRNCGEGWNADEVGEEAEVLAPPPETTDRVGMICPRCGEPEIHPIRWRRLKAIPLLNGLLILLILPIWVFLPKKKCDHCGLRRWM